MVQKHLGIRTKIDLPLLAEGQQQLGVNLDGHERLTCQQNLLPEIITAAIEGFEAKKTRIDAQIAELRAVLPGGPTEPAATPEPPKRKRRKMSAAGRKAIAEAQRKRWAASKRAPQP